MTFDQHDLEVEALQAAWAPDRTDPPEASVAALHAAVAQHFRPRPARWRRRSLVGGAVFASLVSGSATAFAVSGAALPTPIRDVMHAVGLPVDPVSIAETKAAEARLRAALNRGETTRVDADANALRGRLAELQPEDRKELEPGAQRLLQQASRQGDSRSEASGAQPSTSSRGGPRPTPSVPATSTTARSGDGGRGADNRGPGSGTVSTIPTDDGDHRSGATPSTTTGPVTTPPTAPTTTTTVAGEDGHGGGSDGGGASSGSGDGGPDGGGGTGSGSGG